MKKLLKSCIVSVMIFAGAFSLWPRHVEAQIPIACQFTFPNCDGWCIFGMKCYYYVDPDTQIPSCRCGVPILSP